jgi:SAM-dependent methyltransferase
VVEVGAGTGLNISQYSSEAEELILAEPEPAMRCRLERRLRRVEQPDRALAEIARVLRPGGQLLFIEHVRAESPALAWWQDRLLGPWRRFACGCRCNRATVELMRARGFEVTASKGIWRAMPPIVRPLVIGRAQLSGVCDA